MISRIHQGTGKKKKYEMLAKLENLGSFQFFFTLSCADMRWDENYAAILKDQGLSLIYSVITDEDGIPFYWGKL